MAQQIDVSDDRVVNTLVEMGQAYLRAQRRLERIAEAHHKNVDAHGGSYGDCAECGWAHPCPTFIWASTDRDPLSTWDPDDDEKAEDTP